jgi:hypothetical protein
MREHDTDDTVKVSKYQEEDLIYQAASTIASEHTGEMETVKGDVYYADLPMAL